MFHSVKGFIFGKVFALKSGIFFKCRLSEFCQLVCRIIPQLKQRFTITKYTALLPLELDPRRIPKNQIKSPTLVKDIGKLQFPMEEFLFLRNVPGNTHAF